MESRGRLWAPDRGCHPGLPRGLGATQCQGQGQPHAAGFSAGRGAGVGAQPARKPVPAGGTGSPERWAGHLERCLGCGPLPGEGTTCPWAEGPLHTCELTWAQTAARPGPPLSKLRPPQAWMLCLQGPAQHCPRLVCLPRKPPGGPLKCVSWGPGFLQNLQGQKRSGASGTSDDKRHRCRV